MRPSFVLLFLFFNLCLFSKTSVKLIVDSGDFLRKNTFVCVNIAHTKLDKANNICLYELVNGKKIPVPCQSEISKGINTISWILSGVTRPRVQRTFIAEEGRGQVPDTPMQLTDKNGEICLLSGATPLLQYNYKTLDPPAGVDTIFRRSGYIHPVWSPAGNVLTNLQPEDHHHHYGIWNPWANLEYEGASYDLWNLIKRQGTVKFKQVLDKYQGPVFSGFSALHGHVIFRDQSEKEVMDEVCEVKAWKNTDPADSSFCWDFRSTLQPVTALPVILKLYRYGGLTLRGTGDWTKDNCVIFSSEGRVRSEIDETRARWIYVTGECPKGKAGMLMMTSPGNRNYPEPLRIWDEKQNGGRGDVFINFSPNKNMEWTLKPGQKYELNYRIIVYDGEMNPEKAEQLWRDFAYPVEVEILPE